MSKNGNALSILDSYNPEQLPAHLADMAEDSNIAPRMTVPSLSYEGKRWTVIKDGEKKVLQRKNEDGDYEPITTFQGVILDYAKSRGRAYYEGAYDPSKISAPACWSDDGKVPHESVENPVHPKCEGCPMAIKGSRQTDQGKSVAACSQHRMLAVVPAAKLDFQPLRLKLAITSDWDKDGVDLQQQGWYAFQQYLDKFRANKVPHTALVVTKFRFDPNTAFPKVLFQAGRWLTPEEVAIVKPIVKSEEVKALVSGTWSPNGGDGTKTDEAPAPKAKAKPAPEPDEEEAPAPAPKAKAKTKPAPEPEDEGDGLEGLEEETEAPAPRKAAAAPQKAKGKASAPEPDDDAEEDLSGLDGEIEEPAPKAKGKAAKPSREADDADDMGDMPEFLDRRSAAVKAAPKAKAKAAPEPDEEEEAPAPKAKAKPAKSDDLDDLLGEWGGGA